MQPTFNFSQVTPFGAALEDELSMEEVAQPLTHFTHKSIEYLTWIVPFEEEQNGPRDGVSTLNLQILRQALKSDKARLHKGNPLS